MHLIKDENGNPVPHGAHEHCHEHAHGETCGGECASGGKCTKGPCYNAKTSAARYHCKKTNLRKDWPVRDQMGILSYQQPNCRDFEKERCVRLDRAPYVCNGCTKKISHCTIAHKYSYNARFADRKYREKLRDSRTGINMTRRELHKKDQIISPLIQQGQSSLSYPDKPPGTGYVCPYDVFLS